MDGLHYRVEGGGANNGIRQGSNAKQSVSYNRTFIPRKLKSQLFKSITLEI